MRLILFVLALLLTGGLVPVAAQTTAEEPPQVSFKKGIGIVAPDSAFSFNLRFRMQNRAVYNSVSGDDFSVSQYEMRVRRLRLRMEGFMYSPNLTYLVQLSFSRGDMDWSMRESSNINTSPNVVRDAAIYYQPSENWKFTFGQTKLPGNRQRVISSGDQQFVDRSIVNATLNVDRDFGFQAQYSNDLGPMHYMLKGALTSGEGRNTINTDKGLAYTGRVELLPFGKFTNGGDYFEGDLEREETVKVSLAGGASVNDNARRRGAQLGSDLHGSSDIATYIFDGLLKYRGIAFYAEYMAREAENPITRNAAGDERHVYTGNGQNYQLSYIFDNNVELAGRYSLLRPNSAMRTAERIFEKREEAYIAGVTKYLRRHRVKLQGNIAYHSLNAFSAVNNNYHWTAAFQVELGI